jgi:hypothetical protein
VDDSGHVGLIGKTEPCRETGEVGLAMFEFIESLRHSDPASKSRQGLTRALPKDPTHMKGRVASQIGQRSQV